MLVMNFPRWLLLVFIFVKVMLLVLPILIIITKKRNYFLIYYLFIFMVLYLFNFIWNSGIFIFMFAVGLWYIIFDVLSFAKKGNLFNVNTKWILLVFVLLQLFISLLFGNDYFMWGMSDYVFVCFVPWTYFIMSLLRDV